MKRLLTVLLIAFLLVFPVLSAHAENGQSAYAETTPDYIALTDGGRPTLVDRAMLLSSSDAEALSNRLREIGTAYRCDVIVATVPSLEGKSAEAYADDFFDYNGYGYGATPDADGVTRDGDGILLLLSMENRDFAVSTSGYGIKAFTDYGIQTYLEPMFLQYLRTNDYSGGIAAFADGCDDLLNYAREGVPYDCRRIYIDDWSDDRLLPFNDRAETAAGEFGIGIYYLENRMLADADAFCRSFLAHRLLDENAIVLVNGQNGCSIQTVGAAAYAKFKGEKLNTVKEAVAPYLSANDTRGAVNAYFDTCYGIVSDYEHVLTGGALSDTARRSADECLKGLFLEHGVALYFLYDAEAKDPEALVKDFLSEGFVPESNAVVFGANAAGGAVQVKGDAAKEKFNGKRLSRILKDVDPYLQTGDLNGAFDAFATRSEKILNSRPLNWLTLAISTVSGLLFGFVPANGLKRQLTSVSRQKNAEAYMEPDSYQMTQNSNVLLGTSISRSVHIVRTESSGGGGGRTSGGGGFHGGSSTHTSSSGGTHGGHSGKF